MEAFKSNKSILMKSTYVSPWMLYTAISFVLGVLWSIFAYWVTSYFGALVFGICGIVCALSYI
jgi:VIT1/CCC1 family predicted Fe2+/Mn2+ transporter